MLDPQLLKPLSLDSDQLNWTGRWSGRDIWKVLSAARDGDLGRLRASLASDLTLVEAQYWYTAPLHFAVREGHLEAVRLLLDNGANIDYRRGLYGNDTLLTMATDRGHESLLRLLLTRGLRVPSVVTACQTNMWHNTRLARLLLVLAPLGN